MEENKNTVEEEILTEEESAETAEVQEDKTDDKSCTTDKDGDAETEDAPLKFKDKKRLKKAEAELEKLRAELVGEQEKYMRLYAEYDNFRRRSAKEREGVYAEAYCDALEQILPVIDNLERAVQYTADDPESPMAKGIELTVKSCVEALNKMGVYEIEALGKQFDPNLHNAVMHVEDDAFGENEIVEVFMKGYIKGEKVLRFSMVKVAN